MFNHGNGEMEGEENGQANVEERLMRTAGRLLSLFGLVMVFTVSSAWAQHSTSVTDGATPLGLTPGAPAGSYALSGFDTVNPYNGNLNFALPLLQVGGRGGVQHTIPLVLEQHWRVMETPTHVFTPDYNVWTGIHLLYGPGMLTSRMVGVASFNSCPDQVQYFFPSVNRLTFTGPDGSETELRDVMSDGAPGENHYQQFPPGPGCSLVQTTQRGKVFVSADGSAMTFISDSPISDFVGFDIVQWTDLNGFLLMRDGTRYRIDGQRVTWIQDRNGNRMSFQYGGGGVSRITDSLNRVVTITYHDAYAPPDLHAQYDEVTYYGFGHAARSIKIWYKLMQYCLRTMQPGDWTAPRTPRQLFPELGFGTDPDNAVNPLKVSSVELPDGRTYQFSYNVYGELARVVLPTGGAYEYDIEGAIKDGNVSGVFGQGHQIYRRVVQKRTYIDGGAIWESQTTLSKPEGASGTNAGFVEVDQYSYPSTLMTMSKHYYTGNTTDSYSWNLADPTHYSKWQEGKEFQTEVFDIDTTIKQRVTHTWAQRYGSSAAETPPNDPRIIDTTTKLNDTNQVSKQEFDYDAFNNKIEVREYDFGSSTVSRRTHTSYVDGTDYTAVNPSNASPDATMTVHLRSLPRQQSIYDGSPGTERARTLYEYDNYNQITMDNFHAALTSRANITGLDGAYTTTRYTRGNVTATTRYLLNSSGTVVGSVSGYAQYDVAGNLVKAIDPRSTITPPNIIATTLDFTDRFGIPNDEAQSNTAPVGGELGGGLMTYAFATKVTNALGHNGFTQYDYYLGKPVNSEDANGIVNKGWYGKFEDGTYTDALDRPTELVVALNGGAGARRTRFTYNDASKLITTQGDQANLNDGALKSESLYDGLGRTIETHAYESASGYITTKQEFDALGRVSRSYNPYRTTSDSTYGYATTTYDGLGRVLTVTTSPDNAVVTTGYLGNATTVTDQATNPRRSLTDGLGRLTRVDEPTSMGLGDVTSPNQPTSYAYDVLNNLLTVTQGSQTPRRFAYDSLSRLIYAANPEQTTSSGLVFNTQQWAIKYDYDLNSNLTAKTDSRIDSLGHLLQVNYTYDLLNRVTTRSYANDPSGTPMVTYTYDGAGITNSTGRLTTVATNVSTTDYREFDAMGRVTKSRQTTATVSSPPYDFTYAYDRAGNMISETYPSGKVVTMEYDGAERMAGVRNQGSSTYYAGGAASDATNRTQYAAQGAVSAMKLGNGLWEHTDYNTRFQPKQIGLGTASSGANSTSVLGLDYDYGTTANNGNLLTQTISAPGAPAMTAYQCYTYDSLNRLSTAQERSATSCAGTQYWSQNFGYDRFGNRTSLTGSGVPIPTTPTVDPATNRFQSGYLYDNAGNVTNDGLGNQYQYDAENHQTSHVRSGVSSTNYLYDGGGHRVIKAVTPVGGVTTTTVFVYNVAGQLIAEYSDPMPAREGGTKYLTADHLGSTRVVTGSDVSVKARHDYLPFGEDIGLIGGRGNVTGYSANDSTRQKFTQKERDSESGLDYFLARYFSSAQGRFTSVDSVVGSINNPQTLNLYVYTRNNPLRFVDPDGHADLDALINFAGDLALGVSRGYAASISGGLAPNSRPTEADSSVSLFGQYIGSVLAFQEGSAIDAAGGGFEIGSFGSGTAIVIPAEVIGTGMMISAGKNIAAILEMSVIDSLSDPPGGPGPTQGRNNEEAGGAQRPREAGQDVEVRPGAPEEPRAGRTGGRDQPRDTTPGGTVDQLKGLEVEQNRTNNPGYRISTKKSEQNIDRANNKTYKGKSLKDVPPDDN